MKKSILIFISFMMCAKILMAQKNPISFPSPEAASLFSVNLFPVNYHTGEVQIKIPLFDISVNDYHVPISAQYKTTGFQPAIRPTWIGQNWTLDVGGYVCRSVKDIPDETESFGFSQEQCYERFQKDDWALSEPYHLVKSKIYKTGTDYLYDNEPDEFYFAVNGISGRFCFNNNGKIIVLSDPSIKIEYENKNYIVPNNLSYVQTFKGFKLTLNDGTICYFGYDKNLIETNTSYPVSNNAPPSGNATTWCLYKIELPQSGKVILYSYSDKYVTENNIPMDLSVTYAGKDGYCQGDFGHLVKTEHIYLKEIESDDFKYIFSTSKQSFFENCLKLDSIQLISKHTNQNIKTVAFQYTKQRIFLKSIKESDKPAYDFFYNGDATDIDDSFNSVDHWGYYNGYNSNNKNMIPNIIEYMGNIYYGLLRETNSEQATVGALNQIKYPSGAVDKFEFESNMCSRYCVMKESGIVLESIAKRWSSTWQRGIDFKEGRLIVDIPTYIRLSFTPKNKIDVHNINKLLLPGETLLFDNILLETNLKGNINDYNYHLESKSLENGDMYVGGLRIKRITRINGNNTIKFDYKYTNYEDNLHNNNTSNFSTGILGTFPTYKYSLGHFGSNYNVLCSQQMTTLSFTEGSHIGYSEVAEIVSDDFNNILGTKIYKYTNFDTNQDLPLIKCYRNTSSDVNYNFYIGNSKSHERGKKIYEAIYSSKNEKIYQKKYDYQTISHNPIRAICLKNLYIASSFSECEPPAKEGVNIVPDYAAMAYYIYNESFLPSKDVEKKYDINYQNPIVIEKQYYYNKYNLLNKTIQINSDKNKIIDKVSYVCDDIFSNNDIYFKMKNSNFLNYQVEKIKINNDKIIKAELNTYKLFNNKFVLDKCFNLKSKTSLMENSFIKFNGFIKDLNYNKIPEIEFSKYDCFGNVIEIKNKNGLTKSYIWSYNYLYPVAEILNMDYDKVESALGGKNSMLTFSKKSISNTAEIVDFFSPLKREKNAHITLYNYNPFIGPIEKISSRDVATKYIYDNYGRLELVRDNWSKKISEYQYHYKDVSEDKTKIYYNNELSVWFKKNDCPEKIDGASILYTVPAGKYKSIYSQQDANYIAQEDVNKNGQKYANLHGDCGNGILLWNNPDMNKAKIVAINLFEIIGDNEPVLTYSFNIDDNNRTEQMRFPVKSGLYHIQLALNYVDYVPVVAVLDNGVKKCKDCFNLDFATFDSVLIDSFINIYLSSICP